MTHEANECLYNVQDNAERAILDSNINVLFKEKWFIQTSLTIPDL